MRSTMLNICSCSIPRSKSARSLRVAKPSRVAEKTTQMPRITSVSLKNDRILVNSGTYLAKSLKFDLPFLQESMSLYEGPAN